jgi:hypothetical protein
MTTAEEKFNSIADSLPETKKGKMFGALCIKATNGKALAMFHKDNMIFKLADENLKEALSLDGAALFDPMGGRPMGGWAQLPEKHSDKWETYAQKAADYVKTLR